MFFKIAGSPYDGSKKALPTAKLKMCNNKSAIEQIRYFDQLERLSLSNRALSGSTGIFPKARRRVRHAPPREQPSGLIASL